MRRVLAAENLVEQIKLLDHSVDMRMLQPATLSGAMELQITLRARARTAVRVASRSEIRPRAQRRQNALPN
jgi:hypothetical protein